MNLQQSGEEQIPVRPDTVWAFVTDPHKVGQCFPDLVELTVRDATHFDAVVQVGVGPVRGKFKMKAELVPHQSRRRIDMRIGGGGFGSAIDLTAGADLVDNGDGSTTLQWSGQAVPRGPIAAIGGRILDAQAHKLIAQAFANVRSALTT